MVSGFSKLVEKRRKPPPGYSHFMNEIRSGSGRHAPQYVLHDGAVSPAGRGPFAPSPGSLGRPTNTRPTPGSAYRRRRQYN